MADAATSMDEQGMILNVHSESWAAQYYKRCFDWVIVFKLVLVSVNISYIVIIAESRALKKKKGCVTQICPVWDKID